LDVRIEIGQIGTNKEVMWRRYSTYIKFLELVERVEECELP
jgi:hypothetical protein